MWNPLDNTVERWPSLDLRRQNVVVDGGEPSPTQARARIRLDLRTVAFSLKQGFSVAAEQKHRSQRTENRDERSVVAFARPSWLLATSPMGVAAEILRGRYP